ncbi:hypothetical protein [Marinibactrum halimedae]|uniref:Uncharacterized protein n=1 Tax=Marinibactrum halimedae TaxID=1444977 RepID=A0AA37TDJ8_9GAMM|nr:hypothetical protein [Marinibactrum halimedae]MCD9460619.1 hypothetical protein [Marinibactrum halimedae]GLS27835.1 hypothetical protein GCM10007877_35540 [Marinibactrum halimedae]
MAFIALHRPVASDARLERLHLFAGRHLGEEEFDRQQAYADARILPLLSPAIAASPTLPLPPSGSQHDGQVGIAYGLTLETPVSSRPSAAVLASSEHLVVNVGLGVTGKGHTVSISRPLRANWQAIIDDYLTRTATTDATGVYYLVLRQSQSTLDSPAVDPCQRAEFDPTRDSRLVTLSSIELRRIAIAPALVTSTPPEQLQNWIVAERVDSAFLAGFPHALPLAMVAVSTTPGATPAEDTHAVEWVSVAAGRYEATPHSGYRALMNQVHEAMEGAMARFANLPPPPDNTTTTPLETFLDSELTLDFLPAAGKLPLRWLQASDSLTPSLLWLPNHLGIDMVPVPSNTVHDLMRRHLPRRAVDLRTPTGDRLRLLLSINEAQYRPDLLDIPPIDEKLAEDTHRFYMRAYRAWHRWRQQFDVLYHVHPSFEPPLDAPDDVIEHAVLDPEQFKQMDLPKPTLPPLTPEALFNNVRQRALSEFGASPAPYPYDLPNPTPPQVYTDWLVNVDGSSVPPPVPEPDEDGLVVQYAVALVELESIENQIRAIRTRLEKTRDLVLLQRQQLDTQTVALASLAGGVAGDGNGLQVARWLPYASLNTNIVPQELDLATAPQANSPQANAAATELTAERALEAENLSLNANALMLEANFANSFATNTLTQSFAARQPIMMATYGQSTPMKANFAQQQFSQNLLASALNNNAKAKQSYLTRKPQTYSAFELGINKKRLDLLANLSKAPISKPAFQPKEFRFGVLDHISPEINEYQKAYYGMQDLLSTLSDLFDATDATALRTKLRAILSDTALKDPSALEEDITAEANRLLSTLPSPQPAFEKIRGLVASQYRYGALFNAGKILTQWIALCEARYNNIERKLQGKLREHTRQLAHIDKLSGLVRVARETLENLDRFFDEQVGDYGVAQRLIEEDWRRAYDEHQERSRLLTTAVEGLYYVRERATPITQALTDPLKLRHSHPGDFVPGCDINGDAEVPDELNDFMDTLIELPMDDWAVLQPLKPKLPPFHRFEFLNQLRYARFHARPKRAMAFQPASTQNGLVHDNHHQGLAFRASDTLHARLQVVHQQTATLLHHWSARALPIVQSAGYQSTQRLQQDAAKVLSLEDLLSQGRGPLRREAQMLHRKLEQCVGCLLENLALLPGSLRLNWGQLAESDRLKVDNVAYWPGLDTAEQDDFVVTRTLSELIAWLFKQLADDAEAESIAAVRNVVRAVLIYASLGDPQEIVRGQVFLPPKRARVGERFRVKLNRRLLQGAQLTLLDDQQQVAAELTVEDDDNDTTEVRITHLVIPNFAITSHTAVVGRRQ